jgi:hypothetical protein
MDNPSKRSVDQLYGFLEKNSLPITEDGHFLAYKRVRKDYKDIHSGTFDNSIGQVVEMDRNAVDDNPESHCSVGLHFCSESYLGHFGSYDDPVMILKINPADVVSIPTDYDGAKGRCMRYKVVGQVNGNPCDEFSSIVNGDYNDFDDDEFSEIDEDDAPQLNPAAAWPFATPKVAVAKPVHPRHIEDGDDDDEDQLYDVRRVYGDDLVDENIDLWDARELVEKNVRQKKAQLKIVRAGTDEEVR